MKDETNIEQKLTARNPKKICGISKSKSRDKSIYLEKQCIRT